MDEEVFNAHDDVKDVKTLTNIISLRLDNRSGDTYISTAVVSSIQPADNGTTLSCVDGVQNVESITFIVIGRFKHNLTSEVTLA